MKIEFEMISEIHQKIINFPVDHQFIKLDFP